MWGACFHSVGGQSRKSEMRGPLEKAFRVSESKCLYSDAPSVYIQRAKSTANVIIPANN